MQERMNGGSGKRAGREEWLDAAPEGWMRSHPIAVAARRARLSKDVLRAWERRYGVVRPERTANGRRRYTDADIERLRLLGRLTECGRAIGELAELSTADLSRLVRDEHDAGDSPEARSREQPSPWVEAFVRHAQELDDVRLRDTLDRALIALDPHFCLEQVIAPLMVRLGDLWALGRLSPVQERVATVAVTATLRRLIDLLQPSAAGPLIVVGTPPRQRHEVGAMLAAATAAARAWRVVYLGAELPPDEFAYAARARRARAVALGILLPDDDLQLGTELMRLATLLPAGVDLIVGGAGAPAYSEVLASIGARVPTDLAEFRTLLDSLRLAGHAGG